MTTLKAVPNGTKHFCDIVDGYGNVILEGVNSNVNIQKLIANAKPCPNCFSWVFDETNYCEECGQEV